MKSLCDHLCDLGLNLSLDNKDLISITQEIIKYVCGVDESKGAYNFQNNVKEVIKKLESNGMVIEHSAKTFRLSLINNHYVSLRVKFFCLNVALKRNKDWQTWKDSFGIKRNDVVLIKRAMTAAIKKEIKQNKSDLDVDRITPSYFRSLDKKFASIYPSVNRHIKSMTYRKLRFLFSRQNVENFDFESDCKCKALSTFYKVVPTNESDLYIENYVKRAITNHITNIISTYTSDKRRREDTYANDFGGVDSSYIIISENQIKNTQMSYTDLEVDSGYRVEDELNLEIAISKFGSSPKKKALLYYATGNYGKRFTKFLHETGKLPEHKDNTDLTYNQLCKYTSEYLKAPKNNIDKFLKSFTVLVTQRGDLLEEI